MPANYINTVASNTKYYGIKKIKFSNLKGYDVEQPAFIQWNKTTQKNEYVSQSFGGHITKLTLAEPKDLVTKEGKKFTVHNLFVEFYDNANEQKEVVTFEWKSSFAKVLLSKLNRVKNFTDVSFLLGQSQIKNKDGQPVLTPSGDPLTNDWMAVYEGKTKLAHTVISSRSAKEFEDQIQLPPMRWLSKANPANVTEDKSQALYSGDQAVVDPAWQSFVNEVYLDIYNDLQARIAEQRGNVPEPRDPEMDGITEDDLNPDPSEVFIDSGEPVTMPY